MSDAVPMICLCGEHQQQVPEPNLDDLILDLHSTVVLWSVEPPDELGTTLSGSQRDLISVKLG
jgi:hypothetical protein